MSTNKIMLLMSAVLLLVVAGTVQLLGQVTTATLYGKVADSTDAVIPAARVTLLNERTGVSFSQETDAAGGFGFEFIPVGVYTVRVEVSGFKIHETRGFELRTGQRVRRTFVLEVGDVTESVTVTSQAVLLNTVSAAERGGLSELEVSQLPIARRNLATVVALDTGVQLVDPSTTQSTSNTAGSINLNGLGWAGASITMDGIDASANPESPQLRSKGGFGNISVVSLEAVQEVVVNKGVIAAEYS